MLLLSGGLPTYTRHPCWLLLARLPSFSTRAMHHHSWFWFCIANWLFGSLISILHCKLAVWITDSDSALQTGCLDLWFRFCIANWLFRSLTSILHCKLALWISDFDFALQTRSLDLWNRKLHYALTLDTRFDFLHSNFELWILTLLWLDMWGFKFRSSFKQWKIDAWIILTWENSEILNLFSELKRKILLANLPQTTIRTICMVWVWGP